MHRFYFSTFSQMWSHFRNSVTVPFTDELWKKQE